MTRVERFAVFVATGFGVGWFPGAPGTAGSVAALPLAWALGQLPLGPRLAATAVVVVVAIAAAHRAGPSLGDVDDPRIVIDEVAGVCVALLPVAPSFAAFVVGFALFRVADTWKPPPARWCEERLPGGFGVVLDDVAAGCWVAVVLFCAWWAGMVA